MRLLLSIALGCLFIFAFNFKMSSMDKRDFIAAVIDLYRVFPCLWKKQDMDYNNKIKRNLALEELLVLFKKIDSSATIEVVKNKINSLRGSFRKELNKVRFFTLFFKYNRSKEILHSFTDLLLTFLYYYHVSTSIFSCFICSTKATKF